MADASKDFLLRLIFQAENKATGSIKGLKSDLEGAERGMDKTGKAADRMGKQVQSGAQKGQAEIQKLEQRLQSLAQVALGLGAVFAGLGAAITAPAVIAVKTAMTFEAAMSQVKAVAEATGEEFKRLSEKAEELGATTRYTSEEVAAGLLQLARAGQSTGEILESIKPALDLATAGNIELGDSADLVTNAMSMFSIPAADISKAANTMALSVNKANMDMRQFTEALIYVGPLASGVGMTLEETSAAIGALADQGIRGSQAGTALRGMIASLSSPTVG